MTFELNYNNMDNNTRHKKSAHLVCDSGPFIIGTQIEDLAENVYTLPEVVNEIKDENTRQRLQFISYELKYREPSEPQLARVMKKTIEDSNQSLIGFYVDKHEDNNETEDNSKDTVKEVSEEVGSDGEDNNSGDEEEGSDGEDEGWITPNNVKDIRRQMQGLKVDDEVEEEVSVGCLTGDYAMQNVLLQMGLKVIGIKDGLRIRSTKQFVLRCFACFKITTKSNNAFCNNCGNYRTLKRVALTVKEDGTKEIYINFKKPINIRGTRYSLPTPRGGKHTNNPVLVADQTQPQNRKTKFAVEEKRGHNCENILTDPEYVNRLNPFAINDVYSRSSRINANIRRTVNPNVTRRPTEDGTKEIYINFKKPINIRGTRYSLPTPRGGKHTNNPVLVADQTQPQNRKTKFAVEEKRGHNCENILTDPEYVNRLNPFAINDVYSRSSRINANIRRTVNPNVTRRPTGNRKKKSNKL
ncbi:unnamed protein product [Medioppia subpectinata]|uniref:RNA-binding protein NOB1 n=1 Tax=Medioppia subpectinata TaxID=1979941 RepID=A0A7R9KNF3_9ACAR|nr:unnamed protein product [Medioppia subpectinata]CAG2105783.1 unnamed protein product [Medioppia subpectinata]